MTYRTGIFHPKMYVKPRKNLGCNTKRYKVKYDFYFFSKSFIKYYSNEKGKKIC